MRRFMGQTASIGSSAELSNAGMPGLSRKMLQKGWRMGVLGYSQGWGDFHTSKHLH